eukprot:1053790-Prymnesium_polylepis.1
MAEPRLRVDYTPVTRSRARHGAGADLLRPTELAVESVKQWVKPFPGLRMTTPYVGKLAGGG